MAFLVALFDQLFGGKEPIDDTVDKLNRKYTIVVLMVLTVPILTHQFAGEPIECFSPTFFTEAQSRYVNSYCWTASTYYVSDESDISLSPSYEHMKQTEPREVKINYYQWAPLILLGEAFLFYIPFLVWRLGSWQSGIALSRIAKRLSSVAETPFGHPDRNAIIAECVDQIQILTNIDSLFTSEKKILVKQGALLTTLYLLTKVLYIANVLVQFLLLQVFLGAGYWSHGFDILTVLFSRNEWWSSPRFPLQTMCKVSAANQGVLQQYTCQCVLPINVFNEKIFSLWWFFCALLLPTTIIGIFQWLQLMRSSQRIQFFRRHLEWTKRVPDEVLPQVVTTMVNCTTLDCFLVLRLLEINFGSILVTSMVLRLYDLHQKKRRVMLYEQITKSDDGRGSPEIQPQEHNVRNAQLAEEAEQDHSGAQFKSEPEEVILQDNEGKNEEVFYIWTSEQGPRGPKFFEANEFKEVDPVSCCLT